jgi:MFS transporter, PAT family, beta-lactamase induction signal transducer AmpG
MRAMRLLWALLGAKQLSEASRSKLRIVGFLYFIEGSPVSILWEVLPVYLRLHGTSLRAIGGLRLLELPFSLKFLWSPLVQRFGDRRAWVTGAMLVVALVVAVIPATDPAQGLMVLFVLILVLTTASATQDMAIDAYTVALVGQEEQGPANGVRASAYRVALVLIGSGMVALAYWVSWAMLFWAAALVFAALAVAVRWIPPLEVPVEARRNWLAPFLSWIGTWRAVPLVLFVLTYKLGEFAIGPMVKPFWVDQGRSLLEIGLVPTALGIGLSIAGALVGGAFMQRYGTLTALWALGLPQAISNLGYAAVAQWQLPWPALYAASMIDSFSGGLGTAAFLGFFLAVCDPERATLQYAFLSSLFSFTGRLAGAVSGLGTERWGYGPYFAITFLASLPGLLLVPFIASWLPAKPVPGTAAQASE